MNGTRVRADHTFKGAIAGGMEAGACTTARLSIHNRGPAALKAHKLAACGYGRQTRYGEHALAHPVAQMHRLFPQRTTCSQSQAGAPWPQAASL